MFTRLTSCTHRVARRAARPHEDAFQRLGTYTFDGCVAIDRLRCHAMRDFYVRRHTERYERVLMDPHYQAVMCLTPVDIDAELRCIRDRAHEMTGVDTRATAVTETSHKTS